MGAPLPIAEKETLLKQLKRLAFRAAVALSVTAALAACGSNSADLPAKPAAAGEDTVEKILADAPVADAGAVRAVAHLAKIKERGTLNVGGTETATLFSLRDPLTGRLTGFDATMSRLLATYILGKPETKLVQVTAQTRELLLQNGTADTVFATYTITPARAEKIAFAGPYYSSGTAVLVRKGETKIKSVADLNGRTVATQSNSTAATALAKSAPNATPLLLGTNDECVQALRQSRADAYVIDQAILIGNATRNNDVKIVGAPFTEEPYGIGLPPGDPQFKAFVNDWLKKVVDSGLWARVWKLTIGTVVEGGAPTPPAIGSVAGS
jgi:glutamate transport system substrate-binding protein